MVFSSASQPGDGEVGVVRLDGRLDQGQVERAVG